MRFSACLPVASLVMLSCVAVAEGQCRGEWTNIVSSPKGAWYLTPKGPGGLSYWGPAVQDHSTSECRYSKSKVALEAAKHGEDRRFEQSGLVNTCAFAIFSDPMLKPRDALQTADVLEGDVGQLMDLPDESKESQGLYTWLELKQEISPAYAWHYSKCPETTTTTPPRTLRGQRATTTTIADPCRDHRNHFTLKTDGFVKADWYKVEGCGHDGKTSVYRKGEAKCGPSLVECADGADPREIQCLPAAVKSCLDLLSPLPER